MTATYDELKGIAQRTPRAMPQIVISFGTVGEQFAATRVSRRAMQCRVWRPSSHTWTKWRPISETEVLRLAGSADRDNFKPDFGPVWEENW